jgi:hypothetical protein
MRDDVGGVESVEEHWAHLRPDRCKPPKSRASCLGTDTATGKQYHKPARRAESAGPLTLLAVHDDININQGA